MKFGALFIFMYKSPYCQCGNYVEANTDRCGSCNREARKFLENVQKDTAKIKKMLKSKTKNRSSKRAKQETEYSSLGPKFLSKNPFCQVDGCRNVSEQVHHKAGRIGVLLLYTPWWLAVCAKCHTKIELEPEWAKAKSYSLSRLEVSLK